ncbi:MAG: hypothetical protein WCI19_08205 [Betaproteobacteria bacterium]|nr:hypothetical protein [Rhodocyclales bacterium]
MAGSVKPEFPVRVRRALRQSRNANHYSQVLRDLGSIGPAFSQVQRMSFSTNARAHIVDRAQFVFEEWTLRPPAPCLLIAAHGEMCFQTPDDVIHFFSRPAAQFPRYAKDFRCHGLDPRTAAMIAARLAGDFHSLPDRPLDDAACFVLQAGNKRDCRLRASVRLQMTLGHLPDLIH